jgi:3-oxoacyl-[acyl-carrier-protein] synthase II
VRRVAVTGIGAVTPLGNAPRAVFERLARGESAIRRLDLGRGERRVAAVGASAPFEPPPHWAPAKLRLLDRVSQLALAAAAQAIDDAREPFGDRARAGVSIGTGMGGSATMDDGYHALYAQGSDRVLPFTVLLTMSNAAAAWIGIEHGLSGPNLTYSTACSSSAVAIGEAARRVATGEVDTMVAGGAEAPLTFGTIKAWEALKTLAVEDARDPAASCKPFAGNRTGLVLGEGAAVVVLEALDRARSRGAHVYGEVAGYGLCTDSAHITRPGVEGQAQAMRLALDSAGLAPEAIGYVNAHGTGTLANDGVETAALRAVFGAHAARMPVSSTKSMHGHLLGAAGALEFVIALIAMETGVVPPTINLDVADPQCDLDYVPNLARRGVDMQAVMSSSFAFGGTNAVLIARRADAQL